MLSKVILQLSRRNAKDLCKLNRIQSRTMATPAIKEPHFNDVPVPYEPFEAGYKRRQVGNNFVLIAGIAFFTASFAFVYNSGVIYLNPTPPKKNLGEF